MQALDLISLTLGQSQSTQEDQLSKLRYQPWNPAVVGRLKWLYLVNVTKHEQTLGLQHFIGNFNVTHGFVSQLSELFSRWADLDIKLKDKYFTLTNWDMQDLSWTYPLCFS